jgi:hypothetical protein
VKNSREVRSGACTFVGMKHHLSTLSVLHYVYGVIEIMASFGLLFLVGMGMFLNSDWLATQSDEPIPPFAGLFMQILGWSLFAFVVVHGLLNLWSGWSISHCKNRTLSMITAALNCLNIPFGIALGIFTFITLSDREVRSAYGLNY